MVKKEVFEWIKAGRKTIELRTGKLRLGTKMSFNAEEIFSKAESLAKMK